MEVGGYRELDLRKGCEYYKGTKDIARLNAGRCGIYYALCVMECNRILIPYYECSTVWRFMDRKEVEVSFYHIDEKFLPTIQNHDESTAFLVVNYFGLMKRSDIEGIVRNNKNVIIDNTQAFFEEPVVGAYNVYSPRKFVGVPDGCYVIGRSAENLCKDYEQDSSADTASFLLSRIESGGNRNYSAYLENENRVDKSNVRKMSLLTHRLLDNIDYESVKEKRRENFRYARSIFDEMNVIDKSVLESDGTSVPMVYPLVFENKNLRQVLKDNSIFVGQWWKYIIDLDGASEWEKYLSKYLFPIQIDQRYGKGEIDHERRVVGGCKG